MENCLKLKGGKKMNEIVILAKEPERSKIVPMHKMPLGSIGKIISNSCKGEIVRRTCSSVSFCVESLSTFKEDSCWTALNTDIQVELLTKAKMIIQL
jgi:hypothetical protein